jgi:hypothetical protein
VGWEYGKQLEHGPWGDFCYGSAMQILATAQRMSGQRPYFRCLNGGHGPG